jgi:precorrin-4/cobalt-precorrin-4 C11-methyltransferase
VLTRLASRTAESVPDGDSISGFAAAPCTLAIFLSAARPEALQQELLAPPSRLRPDTPAAIVIRASWPDEKVVESTVGNLAEDIRLTGETKTVLVLVGDALAGDGSGDGSGGGALRSHLYSPEFAHAFRRRSAPGTTTGRPAATGRVRARRRATGG